tara:strand:- start:1005 stop:3485 length:2481 start_codon:yes stop_codon:yes gene_type:complete
MGTQVSINGKVIYLSNDNVTIDQVKNSEKLKNKYKFDENAKIEILSGYGSEGNTDLEEQGFFQSLQTKAGNVAKAVSDFITAENRDPDVLTIDELPVSHNLALQDLKNQYGRPDSDATSVQEFYKQIFLEATSEDSEELAKERLTNINKLGNLKDQTLATYENEFDKKLKQLRLQLLIPMTDDKRINAIKNIHMDTKFGKDESGNMTITWKMPDGKGKMKDYTFYPNPTGLDQTDILQASTSVIASIPMTRIVKAIGLPTTGFLGGTATGVATGLGLGEGGVQSGRIGGEGDLPIERTPIQDAVYGGMFGGFGQKAGEVISSLAGAGLRKAGAIFSSNGSLRPEVRNALREQGFSTEEIAGIKGEVLKKMNELVSKQVEPTTATNFGLSKNMPEPIPLTRGEMSGNKAQQVFENQIEEGVFGEGAGMNAMKVLRQQQRDAIDTNIPKLQEELAGGNPIVGRNDMGEDVQKALDLKKTAEYDQADKLYIDARSTQPVFVNADDVTNVHTKMLEAFESDFGDLLAPTTFQFIQKFENAKTIREMFDIRKKLSTLSNSSSDGTERGASSRIVSILDDELDKISTRILGEKWNGKVIPDNIAKWFEAIKGYKDYSNKWNNGILDVITKNRNGKFDISAESVANKIFNMSAVSWAGKPNFLRSLKELKDNLDPSEFNKIQQEGFIRLLDMGQKGKDFSGTTFSKNFEDLKRKAPKVLDILFGKEMLTRITQFAKISEKATSGAKNTSRSTSSLLNMLWMTLGGQRAVLVTPVLNSTYKGIASQRGNARINYDKQMFDPKGVKQPSSGVGLSSGFGTTREDEGDPFMDRPRL